ISKLALVLDIYSSLSLIWRYSYCPVFQGATSDKNFKRRFQQWLNTLWKEKDEQIDNIKSSYKNAGQ
ncbi:hypothetical protein RF039_25105, partial [Enterobacter sichuanensis]|nr:hypothetical protein [Enterobacter sichuanensis]